MARAGPVPPAGRYVMLLPVPWQATRSHKGNNDRRDPGEVLQIWAAALAETAFSPNSKLPGPSVVPMPFPKKNIPFEGEAHGYDVSHRGLVTREITALVSLVQRPDSRAPTPQQPTRLHP